MAADGGKMTRDVGSEWEKTHAWLAKTISVTMVHAAEGGTAVTTLALPALDETIYVLPSG